MSAATATVLRPVNVRFATFGGELIRQAEPLHITPRGQLWVRMLDNGQRRLIDTSSLVMPHEMQAADEFAPRTVPAVYASELPACRGACDQGRSACAHPAVCATPADTSTEDDLPGPVTQSLALDQAERELLAERRTLARAGRRIAALLAVLVAGAALLGCGGGDPVIAQATNQPGAFVTPVWPGVGEVVAARLEITCPAACVIDVDQQSSWVWTAEAPDTGLSATVDVVKAGDKRLSPGTRMDLLSSGGPGPWSAAVGLQRQFRAEAGEPVVIELRVSLDQPTRRLAVTNARLTAEGRAL